MTIDYVLKRLGMFVLIIFVAGTLNFAVPRLRPTNPIEEAMNQLLQNAGGVNISNVEEMIASYEERFGLNNPLWKQYVNYWISLSRLDFGQSIRYFPAKVTEEIHQSLPWTIGLVGVTTIMAALIGSFFGAWLGWTRTPIAIAFVVPLLLIVTAVPFYLLGLLMMWVFTVFWPLLPGGGAHDFAIPPSLTLASIIDIIEHAILPAAAIILSSIGFWGLGMRGMMVTTMGDDFIKLAEFKGLKERRIFLRYAVRNALLPQPRVRRLRFRPGRGFIRVPRHRQPPVYGDYEQRFLRDPRRADVRHFCNWIDALHRRYDLSVNRSSHTL